MNSTTLICKRCKAPLEYEEGSSVLRCQHCGYTEKIDESDKIAKERIWARAYKETELEKAKIETDADIKAKKIHLEEKSLGIKKVKYIIYAIGIVLLAALICYAVYHIQHIGKIYINRSYYYYTGTDYAVAHRLLSEAGFENIEDIPQATLSKKELEHEGKVTQVSIDGDTGFKKGWFSKKAAVTIYYDVLDPKHADDICVPLSRTDCLGKNYQTIFDKFSAEGFYNIELCVSADLSMEQSKQNGKVTQISINNSEKFNTGDYFPANSIIQIDYHTIDPERMADVQIPASYEYYSQTDYVTAYNDFVSAGFTNVMLVPNYDVGLFTGSKSGDVQKITVNGESTFNNNTWLPFDTEVEITYYTKELKYLEKNYLEIYETLFAMGFSDIEQMPQSDLGTDEMKKDGQVKSVQVDGTELSEAKKWSLSSHITIQYHSERQAGKNQIKTTKSSKEMQGEQYEDVVSFLKSMGFTNVTEEPLEDLLVNIIPKDGSVSKVSIGGIEKFSTGEIFDQSAKVVVSYHSLKPKSEAPAKLQPADGQVRVSIASKELKGKNYKDVLSSLQEMGFTNIVLNPLGDIKKGWLYDEGEVKSVSIAGSAKFSTDEIFDANAEVIILYHSSPSE